MLLYFKCGKAYFGGGEEGLQALQLNSRSLEFFQTFNRNDSRMRGGLHITSWSGVCVAVSEHNALGKLSCASLVQLLLTSWGLAWKRFLVGCSYRLGWCSTSVKFQPNCCTGWEAVILLVLVMRIRSSQWSPICEGNCTLFWALNVLSQTVCWSIGQNDQ